MLGLHRSRNKLQAAKFCIIQLVNSRETFAIRSLGQLVFTLMVWRYQYTSENMVKLATLR